MPTTRRSIGSAKTRSAPTKGQSTLSFSNKVTKNVPSHTKSNIIAADDTKVKAIKQEIPAVDEVKEVTVEEESEEEDSELVEESETEFQEEEVIDEKSELELKAEKLSDAQITKYWKTLEKARSAPRVHQKDLSVSEKVLRYFDVCSQYGVSVYFSRALVSQYLVLPTADRQI